MTSLDNKSIIKEKLNHLNNILFPKVKIFKNEYSWQCQIALLLLFSTVFSLTGFLIPANGFIGFDWIHFFEPINLPAFYPPWSKMIITSLNWEILIGLTLASLTLAILKRSVHPISAITAFFSLPLFWTLFLGQIDGLLIFGLLGLPWLAPLALIKPQVTFFAFLTSRSYLASLIITLLISFIIWGFWVKDMFSVWIIHEEGKYVNDIALGYWVIPISIILLWFSRGDLDMLMAAGVFATPYLLPYNLIPLVPSISRLNPKAAVIAAALSWLPLSANWINGGWFLGWLFVIWLWIQLAISRYSKLIQR